VSNNPREKEDAPEAASGFFFTQDLISEAAALVYRKRLTVAEPQSFRILY
jgi:hypothetical protein